MSEFVIKLGEPNPKLKEFSEKNKGETFFVKFDRLTGIRKLSKNAAYWAGIVSDYQKFFAELGNSLTLSEVHEWIKQQFHGEITPFGMVGKSTKRMSDEEFKDFMQRAESWLQDKKELIYAKRTGNSY